MALALIFFITAALVVIALTAILNALVFPRLAAQRPAAFSPRISILIPARDEAKNIGATVSSLLRQTHPNYEVIVLDDDSQDGTAEAARAAGDGDERLRVIHGQPLPRGWMGKNWACHQLAQAASGEWLVFTDADVRWSPDGLAALSAMMQRTRADLLTVWPTQITESRGERLVVPLMALAVVGYLPLPLVHHTPWRPFAAANGQCMAFRRGAYRAVGGHAAVKGAIVEDVALSRRIKAAGLRLRMADGAGLISCRMYRGWPEVRAGFGKNILAGYGDSVLLLAASTVFHWALFVLPWIWLLAGFGSAGWPGWPLLLVALGVGARALTAAVTRQRIVDAVWMPASVVLMTLIAVQAVWWRGRFGGPRWKGRTITTKARGAAHG
ncbi:MAG: glycosyltransferase [Chloroflexi bacterium]|nr:glycosyltransferase [Chloroflexota bacterium]